MNGGSSRDQTGSPSGRSPAFAMAVRGRFKPPFGSGNRSKGNCLPWSGKICAGKDAPGRGGVGAFNHVKRDICVAGSRASETQPRDGEGRTA